jgi:hypothetical protein
MMMMFFWVMAPCRLVGRCQHFGETYVSIFRAEVAMLVSGGIYIITALMMKALSTFETSVNFYQTTRRNILEGSHLHTRRCENLKSYLQNSCLPDARL